MATQLSILLKHYSLTEVADDFAAFDARYGVLPAAFRDSFEAAFGELLAAATERGLGTAHQLLREHGALLRDMVQVDRLTGRHALADRTRLHTLRNVLLTVVLGAAHHAEIDTAGIAASVTTLTRRTDKTDRALLDDEIALMRTRAALAMGNAKAAQAATLYALCDAGCTTGEATAVTPADLDGTDAPSLVQTGGEGRVEARFLPLDGFHAKTLRTRVALGNVALDRPVAYNPRKHAPGSKDAGVSAHIIVTRYLKELGLKHSDTTAASVRRWRVATAWRESGLAMAMEIAGLSERDTIRLAPPEPIAHTRTVRYTEDNDF